MARKIRFVPSNTEPSSPLVCGCANRRFLVTHEQMARQSKTMKAHHTRIVAECSKCGQRKTIGYRW